MTHLISSILHISWVDRIRRNHGLEHATLHVLSQRYPRQPMAGRSSTWGFWLIGEVPTEAVTSAVQEALARLKAGERHLAVHPNCGTNFATSGTLAGVAGAMAMFGAGQRLRDKLERLPLAASFATLALIISQPLALSVQAHITTSGVPGDLEVARIASMRRGGIQAYQVFTKG